MPKVSYPNLLSVETDSSFDLRFEEVPEEALTVLTGPAVTTLKPPVSKFGIQITNRTTSTPLVEGVHYTVDYSTGVVSFSGGVTVGDVVVLTYQIELKALGKPKVTITAKFDTVDGASIQLLRKKGEYARGPDSAAKTIDSTTVTATEMSWEDTDDLEPGTWYYYSLIIEVASLEGYSDTSFADALAYDFASVRGDTFGSHLYGEILPPVYQQRDRTVEEGLRHQPLRRMLEVLSAALDMVKSETDTTFDRFDPRTVRAKLLPEIDYMLGWPTNFEVSESIQRAETLQAVALWKRKGTASAIETAAQTSSRFDATVRMGRTAVFTTNTISRTGTDSTWTSGSTTVTSSTSGEFLGLRAGELIRRDDESTFYMIEEVVSTEELRLLTPYGAPVSPGPATTGWADNGSITPDTADTEMLAQLGKLTDPIRVTPEDDGWKNLTGVGIFLVPLSGFALPLSDTIDAKLRRVLPDEILGSGATLGLVVDFEVITDIWDMRRVTDDFTDFINTPGLEDSYSITLVSDEWRDVLTTTTTVFTSNTVTHLTNSTDYRTPVLLDTGFTDG